jgi:hypothetical protein
MSDDESSIDGSLEEFLAREGIKGYDTSQPVHNEDMSFSSRGSHDYTEDISAASFQSTYSDAGIENYDLLDLLIPSAAKVNKIMQDSGFTPIHLTKHDIDSTKKMSVYVVDAWAQSLLGAITEMKDRIESHKLTINSTNFSQRKNEVSNDALEQRVRDLQEKLLDCERKLKTSELNAAKISEKSYGKTSLANKGNTESKRMIKNLEEKVRESERRVRQRDMENERLKDKLRIVVEKERETAKRQKETLTSLKSGGGGLDTSFTSTSSVGSKSSSATSISRSRDVLEALESQRDELEKRNTELDSQVIELASALKDALNGKNRDSLNVSKSGAGASFTHVQEEGLDELERTSTAQAMYDKIKDQSRIIDKLNHRLDSYKNAALESAQQEKSLRAHNDELHEELENTRLEMDNRPTPKAWSEKQKELREVENKFHDLVMMRGEAAELEAWRKHMSVSDRIKIDKRNHELGLWVLDSLPKAMTKEILQTVCRELDVSDIGEIAPCLAKLKAVVKAVPRMERFISQICDYLFERDRKIAELNGRGFAGRSRPSMEDVMPVLTRWWSELQQLDALGNFQDKVLAELHRREQMLAKQPISTDDADFGPGLRFRWSENEINKAYGIIRGCIDFEAEVLKHKKSFGVAEDFLRDQPELLINRQIAHIQYLFNISTIEGIYPRMNQVYLFHEQMTNFLNTSRQALDMKSATDASIISELQRIAMQDRTVASVASE